MTIATPVNEPMPREPRYAWTEAGRLRDDAVTDTERNLSVLMHLSPLAFFVVGPLAFIVAPIIWFVQRRDAPFVEDHGREFINYWLSFVLLHLILAVTVILSFLIPVLWIVAIVSLIRGAVASGQGEIFRYPMTFRFVSAPTTTSAA